MTEAEVAKVVINHYQDYEIFKEVEVPAGRCDILVKKGPVIYTIEVKKQFNFDVIGQALRNFKCSHYASVAVLEGKRHYYQKQICKRLGIGVIYVFNRGREWSANEVVAPLYRRGIKPPELLERHKLATAGAQVNEYSEFKMTVRNIIETINSKGGSVLIDEFFYNNHYHYSHPQSAKQCITALARKGKIEGLQVNGKYLQTKNLFLQHDATQSSE